MTYITQLHFWTINADNKLSVCRCTVISILKLFNQNLSTLIQFLGGGKSKHEVSSLRQTKRFCRVLKSNISAYRATTIQLCCGKHWDVIFTSETTKFFCDCFHKRVRVHTAICLETGGRTDVDIINEDHVGDKVLFQFQFIQKDSKVIGIRS